MVKWQRHRAMSRCGRVRPDDGLERRATHLASGNRLVVVGHTVREIAQYRLHAQGRLQVECDGDPLRPAEHVQSLRRLERPGP